MSLGRAFALPKTPPREGTNSPLLPRTSNTVGQQADFSMRRWQVLSLEPIAVSRRTFANWFSYTARCCKVLYMKHCVGPSVKGFPEKVKTGNKQT